MNIEDIEKEADKRYKHPHIDNMDASGHQAFCEGAEWMQEQFENNRLEHCDRQTPDEAKREMDFVTAFIKDNGRTPTFSDCIEMTRKELVEKACDYFRFWEYSEVFCDNFKKAMEE